MIGRPQESEAADYFFTYIDQVPGDDAVAAIESQLEESLALFAGISEETRCAVTRRINGVSGNY